jgi:hypothetical protein
MSIDLGGGATADSLSSVPTPYSSNGKVVEVSAKPGAAYAYRLTGGVPVLKMGCVDPYILVESSRQLGTEELWEILHDASVRTHVPSCSPPPGVVSIGWRCPGARPPASPGAQAQADAEGWNMEKWRKRMAAELGSNREAIAPAGNRPGHTKSRTPK